MLDDVVGEIDARRILNECEASLAAGRVPSKKNVLLQLGNVTPRAVGRLLHDGLEVRVQCRHEALSAARARGFEHAQPPPGNGGREEQKDRAREQSNSPRPQKHDAKKKTLTTSSTGVRQCLSDTCMGGRACS